MKKKPKRKIEKPTIFFSCLFFAISMGAIVGISINYSLTDQTTDQTIFTNKTFTHLRWNTKIITDDLWDKEAPDVIEIADNAFDGTKIKSIEIPLRINVIGRDAFKNTDKYLDKIKLSKKFKGSVDHFGFDETQWKNINWV